MKKKMTGIMLLAALFSVVSVQAADNLQFRGNLIIPNCTINNNQPFTIEWRDVEIQTFNSQYHAYHVKEVNIPLDCPYYYNTPKLTLTGKNGGGTNYIQTSKHNEGLAISVRQGAWSGNNPVTLGQKTNIVSDAISGTGRNKHLKLGFALTRTKKIEDLTPGEFTASANLEVRYE
ncbi:fimbrial protein [Escherichia coli]|uniref:fimbrial protein n=1 Tax=Escherichia coli TaxID=562 RepID=UPI001F299DA4|nr:fimbrial protein [Escherichia coli]MCE9975904.1 fimbrial protein [Escherichia coli]MCE9989529.1 fimbrial protein [Escherichia coli]